MRDIDEALARIARRRPKVIDLSLDRVFAALERMGAPHLRLPPVFHVAGTNGKGSTVAYLKAILEAAGKSVHAYTSPHLVRFNERIVLAGQEISDEALIAALEECDRAVGEDRLTYFETITCAALLAFSQSPADFLVMEVGLGGRLDATNVIEKPAAAIVSDVDLDHQQFLGDSLGAIAREKAGIFRRGAPAVIGPQQAEAMAVLRHCADEAGAPVFAYGEQWNIYSEHGRIVYQDDNGLSDLDPPRLAGAHQVNNAGLAIAAIKVAGLSILDAQLSEGLQNAFTPARLQRLTRGPLVDRAVQLAGDEVEVWLDGGHNPHAGRAIARAMADMEERRSRPLILIAGMQANKDAVGYFAPFAGLARAVFTVAADHEGVSQAGDVAAAARRAGLDATRVAKLDEAMAFACRAADGAPARILICGSLYLAGEVLQNHA